MSHESDESQDDPWLDLELASHAHLLLVLPVLHFAANFQFHTPHAIGRHPCRFWFASHHPSFHSRHDPEGLIVPGASGVDGVLGRTHADPMVWPAEFSHIGAGTMEEFKASRQGSGAYPLDLIVPNVPTARSVFLPKCQWAGHRQPHRDQAAETACGRVTCGRADWPRRGRGGGLT